MKTKVAVIGSGPSALIFAAHLDPALFEVHLFEKNAAAARKLLVAGDGGLNLSHAEDLSLFVTRYHPQAFIEPFIRRFTPAQLREWLASLGIETYVGSSRRIFPLPAVKPVEVLEAILKRVRANGAELHYRHEWLGWEGSALLFRSPAGETTFTAGITVLALGGASWPVTGTTGSWSRILSEKGIEVKPFAASNSAVLCAWPAGLLGRHEGHVLKGIVLRCGNRSRKGDVVIRRDGMEGGPVYFLSPDIRHALQVQGHALLLADLQPDRDAGAITSALRRAGRKGVSDTLKKLGLGPAARGLLRSMTGKEDYQDPEKLAQLIKAFPVTVTATGPVEDAISTVGGLALEETDESLGLKKIPGCFALGEMLDWDAPTGGYLLQACFSMGYVLAQELNMRGG